MNDVTIILITLIVLVFATLIAYLILHERAEDRRERRRLTAPARAARHAPPQGGGGEALAPWVAQVLESFGVDEDILFEDEMPDELRTLLPIAKGFVKSGGLEKLLQGGKPPGGDQDGGFIDTI